MSRIYVPVSVSKRGGWKEIPSIINVLAGESGGDMFLFKRENDDVEEHNFGYLLLLFSTCMLSISIGWPLR